MLFKITLNLFLITTLSIIILSLFHPQLLLIILSLFIKLPHPLTNSFLLKLKLLKLNMLFSIPILILLILKSNKFLTSLKLFYKYIHLHLNQLTLPFLVIILFNFFTLSENIIDLETIIAQKLTNQLLTNSTIILPNKAAPADFYPPTDFNEFISYVKIHIPNNKKILYLGVEKDIANYFLYPRKLYKPPDYNWLFLPTEKILSSAFCKDKKIDYIIKKYRPHGFKIEKITK